MVGIRLVRPFPLPDGTRLGGKTGPYLIQFAGIRNVLTGIPLLFDLPQGLVRRTVQLELEDIHILGRFKHAVHTTLALLLLHIDGIDAYQAKYKIESVLEVTFTLPLIVLAAHRIGNTGKKGSEKPAQSVGIACSQRTDYITNPTARLF